MGDPFLNGPTNDRVLVVGDTHGDYSWLREVVIPMAQSQSCGRIMQLGDFGFVWSQSMDDMNHVLDALDESLTLAGVALTFLPGNHENHPRLAMLADLSPVTPEGHYAFRSTVHYTGRVSAWSWSGVRLAAVGGGVSIDRDLRVEHETWWPQEVLTSDELGSARQMGPVDVLLTHDAPDCLPMNGLVPHPMSALYRREMSAVGRALTPRWWMHGHYHASIAYPFVHGGGPCWVRSLDCNPLGGARQDPADSMHAIDLRTIKGMGHQP